MNMKENITHQRLNIGELVNDLQPVRTLKPHYGLTFLAIICLISIALNGTQMGWRPDLLAGTPSEMFLLRAGMLALLGTVTAHAVIAMASPSVGKHNDRWQIALACALLFPLAAIIASLTRDSNLAMEHLRSGAECLMMSAIGGIAVAIPMVLWLRKGAPTSPNRAGWLVGISAGGLGAFAYNFHCPFSDIVYTGLWYSLAVAVCAVAGRLVVPPLIRW
jgi:hypothetical protein